MRAVRLGLVLLIAALPAAGAEEPRAPREIVQSAFDRLFNYPSVRSAEFRVFQHGRLVARRQFEVVYRKVDGLGNTLLRFTDPDYLRGTALLMLENADGSEDIWLYRESARRVRRVNTRQRADAFYGTDFTFEDLEHHDWSRFDVTALGDGEREGRAVHVIEAVPRDASQYGRLRMEIEKERMALLRVDFFRPAGEKPIKSLTLSPDAIEQQDGVLVPERMSMVQHGRDGHTEVRFLRVEANPEINPRVFSSVKLERSTVDLFELVHRMKQEEGSD